MAANTLRRAFTLCWRTALRAARLLTTCAPCVVLDPHGRLYRLTADHRRRVFGHATPRIDPCDVVRRYPGWQNAPQPDFLNVLDLIPASSPALIDCANDMAKAIVIRDEPSAIELAFWNDSAELFLSSIIAFILAEAEPNERNLQTVRALLTDPQALNGIPKLIHQSDTAPRALRRCATLMNYYVDRELHSVMVTLGRHTAFLESDRLAACARTTSFDPSRLLAPGDLTLYLCFPKNTPLRFQRLVLTALKGYVCPPGRPGPHRVFFLRDDGFPFLTPAVFRFCRALHRLYGTLRLTKEDARGR